MFEAFFTDPCMRYRTEVINGIDFYGLGFSMVRGECVAEGTLRWMQKGEAAAVLITNTSLPDMSGFELARHVRRQFPCLRVIFLTDTPNLAEAQQAVRCGAYDYLPKSDGIDALRRAMIRVSEELHTESREEAYLRGQQNWDECISRLLKLLLALKPGIDEDHWQMYSKVKPLLSDAPLRMEALLVRSLMEELPLVLHLPGRQKRTKRLLLVSKGVHHYAAGGNQHKTDDSNRGEFFLVCKNRNQRGDNQSNAAPGCVSDIQVDPVQTFCKGVMADNIRRRANQRRGQLCKALRLLQIACGDNLRDNCNGKKCIFHFASQSFLF